MGKDVCLGEGLDEFEFWSPRSVGQIKEIHYGHSRSYDLLSIDQICSQLGNNWPLQFLLLNSF